MMLARNLPEFETWAQVQNLTPAAFRDEPRFQAVVADLVEIARLASAQQGYLPAGEPTMRAAFTRQVHRTEGEHRCDERCGFLPAKTLEEATMVAIALEMRVRADTPIYDAVLAEQHAAKLAQLAGLIRDRVPATVTSLERKRDAHGRFIKGDG